MASTGRALGILAILLTIASLVRTSSEPPRHLIDLPAMRHILNLSVEPADPHLWFLVEGADLEPNTKYEVRVSHLSTSPIDVEFQHLGLEEVQSADGHVQNHGRELLNTEKAEIASASEGMLWLEGKQVPRMVIHVHIRFVGVLNPHRSQIRGPVEVNIVLMPLTYNLVPRDAVPMIAFGIPLLVVVAMLVVPKAIRAVRRLPRDKAAGAHVL